MVPSGIVYWKGKCFILANNVKMCCCSLYYDAAQNDSCMNCLCPKNVCNILQKIKCFSPNNSFVLTYRKSRNISVQIIVLF